MPSAGCRTVARHHCQSPCRRRLAMSSAVSSCQSLAEAALRELAAVAEESSSSVWSVLSCVGLAQSPNWLFDDDFGLALHYTCLALSSQTSDRPRKSPESVHGEPYRSPGTSNTTAESYELLELLRAASAHPRAPSSTQRITHELYRMNLEPFRPLSGWQHSPVPGYVCEKHRSFWHIMACYAMRRGKTSLDGRDGLFTLANYTGGERGDGDAVWVRANCQVCRNACTPPEKEVPSKESCGSWTWCIFGGQRGVFDSSSCWGPHARRNPLQEPLSSLFVPAYFHTSWLLSRCCPTSALPERMVFTRSLVELSAIEASKKV